MRTDMEKQLFLTSLLNYDLMVPMMIVVNQDEHGFISKFDELEAEGFGDTEQTAIVSLMENIEKIFMDILRSNEPMNIDNINRKAEMNRNLKKTKNIIG